MSTADLAGPAGQDGAAAGVRRRGAVAQWTRFLRSELRLVYLRPRTIVLLIVAAVIPALLGVVLWASGAGSRGGGGGPAFLNQVAGNGVFLAFVALVVMLTLILPLVIAVIAGDSIAGEAGRGTLRYLLTVPAGRTRLLAVKYVTVVLFCVSGCLLIAAVAVATGAALFPVGPVTLLSGTTISLAAGLLRLLMVVLYVAAAMASLGAIGVAISTFTEHSIGAIAALLIITVGSEVADSVPQIAAVHPYLPTHWWLSFDGLLRAPVSWPDVLHGLLSFGVYAVIFLAIAWARFTTADVTS
ncbi:MAG TPA: ABC transporter permease [Streptosporangiaceae bacterium]|nr:ABC transporter permease [Streptosporangiaceae bacterium]